MEFVDDGAYFGVFVKDDRADEFLVLQKMFAKIEVSCRQDKKVYSIVKFTVILWERKKKH